MSVLSNMTVPPPAVWKPEPMVLLHPQIPKPLHGMAPRVLLGHEWWEEERRKAYSSTDFHCLACGVPKHEALEHQWLEAHECYKINYYAGRMVYQRTIPLCHYCHCYIHSGRMEYLLKQKQITQLKYDSVMRRGQQILRKVKMPPRLAPPTGYIASWDQWRLIMTMPDGDVREWSPLLKSEVEWLRLYGGKHEGVADE